MTLEVGVITTLLASRCSAHVAPTSANAAEGPCGRNTTALEPPARAPTTSPAEVRAQLAVLPAEDVSMHDLGALSC
jgi:hypothetical protein